MAFDYNDVVWTGQSLTPGMVEDAERTLGVRLPAAYLAMLRVRNGGVLRKCRFDTTFPTSWADDHFAVQALLGIGGINGVDAAVGGS
ncbi:SMI1/KNR4 family protein [Glycomyces sambucus]|uniref:SMI1/KNR4 family protein n=1 Tax=Glycomyces sambucus TaxID=380244 RepID=UPI001C40A6B2|nr:SMI1/KNR4 family protein [Glycomyces sambucus]